MYEELNKQIAEAAEKLRLQKKIQSTMAQIDQSLREETRRLADLAEFLEKEKRDYEKIEAPGLAGLFYSILGNRDKKVSKEWEEFLAAKLKYEECQKTVLALENEAAQVREQWAGCTGAEKEYKELMESKKARMMASNDEKGQKILELTESLAKIKANSKELDEAVYAGNQVRNAISQVISSLESAEGWGTWDMLGGGLIATAAKHSKIDDARAYASEVQNLMRKFQYELKDVSMNTEISIDVGSFGTFADYFFDGLIADWSMQSSICSSIESASRAAGDVDRTINQLKARERNLGDLKSEIQEKINQLVEEA